MQSSQPLDATITVNQLVQRFPDAVGALSALGIDTCCRGNQSLAMAAAAVGVDPDRLFAEVTSAQTTIPLKSCGCGCHETEKIV
jgi:iron-sulfur cluster repair protein YtfE (RIC family)